MRLPRDMLPDEPHARHGRLRDYFCDKDATAVLDGGEWVLSLAWPGGPERHVDPRIGTALRDWGGIGLDEMALAHRRSGLTTTALYDTWTLVAWSRWVAEARPASGERITVLHVDDHRDLGAPRLGLDGAGMTDMLTGRAFDVRDPDAVLSACASGAVGMGSFMTPFLHAFPDCDVRQLSQAPKVTSTTDHVVEPVTVPDDMLDPGRRRPAIRLREDRGVGPGRYRITADVDDWLEGLRLGPVLLHVDMDYFNNRYDGDVDWPDRHPRHDPALGEVLERIDVVAQAVRAAGVLPRIAASVVAYSPGFFPAEFWRDADERLRRGLGELYE